MDIDERPEETRRRSAGALPHGVHRASLTVLLLPALGVGGWAYAAPESWYQSFPGFGLRWLPPLGPYNEHFVKDVGAMYLGLAVLSACAIIFVANSTLVRVTAGTWTTFNALHLLYHLQMLHMYNTRDQILNVITLTTLLLVSVILFVPVRTATASNALPHPVEGR